MADPVLEFLDRHSGDLDALTEPLGPVDDGVHRGGSYLGDLFSNLGRELYDEIMGTGRLMAMVGLSPVMGIGPPESVSPRIAQAQSALRPQYEALGEGIKNIPWEIVGDIKRLLTEAPTFVREEPITALTTAALPFGLAGVGLKGGAKLAGVMGQGAPAKALRQAGETISPGNLATRGARELTGRVPVLREILQSHRVGKEGLLDVRGARRRASIREATDTNQLMKHIDALTPADRELFQPAVEGLLPKNTILSPALQDAIREYSRVLTGRQERILDSADTVFGPGTRKQLEKSFENAPWIPLAKKLDMSPDVVRKTALADDMTNYIPGGIPLYFPHTQARKLGMETADQFIGKLSTYTPGFLKARKGSDQYTKDVGTALTNHHQAVSAYQRSVATIEELKKRGVRLPSDAIEAKRVYDALEADTGYKWVVMQPHLYTKMNQEVIDVEKDLLRALDAAGEGNTAHQAIIDAVAEMELSGFTKATAPREMWALPKEVVKQVQADLTPPHPSIQLFVDAPTDLWRTMVLPYSPRWWVGNVIGSAYLTLLSGANPVRGAHWSRRLRDDFPPEVSVGLTRETVELMERTAKGAKEVEIASVPVGDWLAKTESVLPTKTAHTVTAFLYRVNQATDDLFRNIVFADRAVGEGVRKLREEGRGGWFLPAEDIEKATREILKDPAITKRALLATTEFLGDYASLTPWERNWVRRVSPFWSWHKAMGKLLGKLPVKYPGRQELLLAMAEFDRDARTEDVSKNLSAGVVRLGATQTGPHSELTSRMPGEQPTVDRELTMSARGLVPYGQFGYELTPSVGPLVRMALTALTNTDDFGNPISPRDVYRRGLQEFAIEGDQPTEVAGVEEYLRNLIPNLTKGALRSMPQVRLLEDLKRGRTTRASDPLFGNVDPSLPISMFGGDLNIGTPRAKLTHQTPVQQLTQFLSGLKFQGLNIDEAQRQYLDAQSRAVMEKLIREEMKNLLQETN